MTIQTTMAMKGNWNYPTRIWAGPGRITELPKACEELRIVRPLIVTDSGLRDSAMIRQALALVPTATAGGTPRKIRSGVRMKPPPTPNMPDRKPTAAPMPMMMIMLVGTSAMGK